ncbi:MAG: ATP-binding protein [Phycisphaerae bacterium]|nr:ATP-binding protein [Phycisphaerae bacterium]
MNITDFKNPFRPGAGHMPPYLAGREKEREEFLRLLEQETILENLVLTGLRGVGKTVLLETFKPLAQERGWQWVGTDMSESTSISEEKIAERLITDLAVITSNWVVQSQTVQGMGFRPDVERRDYVLDYQSLRSIFNATPGLVSDKLKCVLEIVWQAMRSKKSGGIVFAYDEAQNLSDHAEKEQYPLSLLLDVFQSIQRKNIPFMLALTGLPTLFPKLVEARTYSERMFRVVFLDRLTPEQSREAIKKPIEKENCRVRFNDTSVNTVIQVSGGYPYFIQFICREVYDVWIQRMREGRQAAVPIAEICRKLDTDFFAGRWSRATDRQRDLMIVISTLPNCDTEFTIQEIVEQSKSGPEKPFRSSNVSLVLAALAEAGLIFKNRHGKYSFAVPLLGEFIKRQQENDNQPSLF